MIDKKDPPITFIEPSFALFDLDANAVLMTQHGNLAIFNTRGMAEVWAKSSRKNVKVMTVTIAPVKEH